MAHEINNPLGGLLNALDTLKRHGERPGVTERSRHCSNADSWAFATSSGPMIETYRPEVDDAHASEPSRDLRLLITPEVRRQRPDPALDDPTGVFDAANPKRAGPPGSPQPASQRRARPPAPEGRRAPGSCHGAILRRHCRRGQWPRACRLAARKALETRERRGPSLAAGVGLRVIARPEPVGGRNGRGLSRVRPVPPSHIAIPLCSRRKGGRCRMRGGRIAVVEDDPIMGASIVQRLVAGRSATDLVAARRRAAAALRTTRDPVRRSWSATSGSPTDR